jgi:hypothetical protein
MELATSTKKFSFICLATIYQLHRFHSVECRDDVNEELGRAWKEVAVAY